MQTETLETEHAIKFSSGILDKAGVKYPTEMSSSSQSAASERQQHQRRPTPHSWWRSADRRSSEAWAFTRRSPPPPHRPHTRFSTFFNQNQRGGLRKLHVGCGWSSTPLVQSDISYKWAHYTSHSSQTANLNILKTKIGWELFIQGQSWTVWLQLQIKVGEDEQLFQPEQLQEDERSSLPVLRGNAKTAKLTFRGIHLL